MIPFLLYIARGGLYLALFYAFYLLVMRRTTFFRLNRALLLAGSYLCLMLPLIRLRTIFATSIASDLTMIEAGTELADQNLQPAFPWKDVLLVLYITGAIVTLVLYLLSARKMGRIIRNGESTWRGGCQLVLSAEDIPSFSWVHKVVMSRKDLQENPAIFTHELMHVQCRHSLDLLLFLPIQIIFWWNPLVWITCEELRLLHEYEADEGVIQQGIDATQYQLLLVRKAVGEQRFSMASGFQHTQLKNRIEMMLKPTSSGRMRWSYLALIPVLAAFMFACNPTKDSREHTDMQENISTVQDAVSFHLIEHKPSFNGGDANEFSKWVNVQLNYPESAKQAGIQGRIVLQFTVGADGVVRDVKVLRGVHEILDAEALRVLSSSPKWEPGYDADGNPVPVTYSYPVIFQLR